MGLRLPQVQTYDIHTRMGQLLPLGGYEIFFGADRRMASPPHKDVYMEIMEVTPHPSSEPYKVRHRQIPRLYVGQHSEGILVHSGQPYTAPSHNEPKAKASGLSKSVGYISRMVSKIGTAVCRTACTVV